MAVGLNSDSRAGSRCLSRFHSVEQLGVQLLEPRGGYGRGRVGPSLGTNRGLIEKFFHVRLKRGDFRWTPAADTATRPAVDPRKNKTFWQTCAFCDQLLLKQTSCFLRPTSLKASQRFKSTQPPVPCSEIRWSPKSPDLIRRTTLASTLVFRRWNALWPHAEPTCSSPRAGGKLVRP